MTPGKWELYKAGGITVKTTMEGYGVVMVADCGTSPTISLKEKQDNARLIAAAPLMLRTLEDISEYNNRRKELGNSMLSRRLEDLLRHAIDSATLKLS